MSAEEFAKLPPEKQELIRQHQQAVASTLQLDVETMKHLMAIVTEVRQDIQKEQFSDIPMAAEENDEVWKKISETREPLIRVGKALGRFYLGTRDDVRARKFFRTRYRISQQFLIPDALSGRKEVFSITLDEIESHRNLLIDMAKDAMNFVQSQTRN